MNRREALDALRARPVDILVIGGGIIGAGIARDAALRGLRVAVVEQHDFASGTTSRPTRLVHGGLRYLEMYDVGLVREDLHERETLLRVAPHLVSPLPFLIPHYNASLFKRSRMRAGMVLYDLLSFDKSLPAHRWLTRQQVLAEEPNIRADGLQGAWRFYDAQVPLTERLVLENLLDASQEGAVVVNHGRAERFTRDSDGGVIGAMVRDLVDGSVVDVRARMTVNATGPWLDLTNRGLQPQRPASLRLTKGVHLVTPGATRNAVIQFARSDGRLFFVTPWLGHSLVGTTDTDYSGDPSAVEATTQDVAYLQSEARQAFPAAPFDQVYYTWAGVRALVRVEGVSEGRVSRKHKLLDHAQLDGVAGLISVVGGKLTAYRGIAEEVVDLAAARLQRHVPGYTRQRAYPGGRMGNRTRYLEHELWPRAAALGVTREQAEHLAQVYGTLAEEVLDLVQHDRALGVRICPHQPAILAQFVRAVETEWAVTLADMLLRRVPLGLAPDQALGCLHHLAARLGENFGWSASHCAEQVAAYLREVAPMRRLSTPAASPPPQALQPV